MIHSRTKPGALTTNSMLLKPHEYATLNVLLAAGHDIELLRPSQTKYVKTGDLWMMGLVWEMKSPTGKSRSTMEHVFQKAAHQAHNIIVDLRRTKIPDSVAIISLEKIFNASRSVRNLWIITKQAEIIKKKK